MVKFIEKNMKFLIDPHLKEYSGIYIIRNSINSKIYIGSTKNFISRFYIHKSELLNNKHHSITLQRFVNKYGIDKLSFELVELCDENILIEKEQFYFDIHQSYLSKFGYNISTIAGRNIPKHTEETKKKISNSLKETYKKRPKLIEEKKIQALTENPFLGKNHNQKTKEAISKAQRGRLAMFLEADVIEIKKMILAGCSNRVIAEKFKTKRCVIDEIRQDRNYNYIKIDENIDLSVYANIHKSYSRQKSTLNTENVLQIKKLISLGKKYKDLKNEFSLSKGQYDSIVAGKSWKDVL